MEDGRRCNKCRAQSVIFDSPNWVCCQCGTVQDSDHFVSHLDVYTENLGCSVAIGRSSATVCTNFGGHRIFIRGDYDYKEHKEVGCLFSCFSSLPIFHFLRWQIFAADVTFIVMLSSLDFLQNLMNSSVSLLLDQFYLGALGKFSWFIYNMNRRVLRWVAFLDF